MRSVISGVFIPVWLNRAYTIREKINIWHGIAFSRKYLWADCITTDLTKQIHKLDLPVYFFTGLYDYTANNALAREFFDQIKAPLKGFYTFEKSAHSPLFEETERARRILLDDVLKNAVGQADAP
jgi:pimeloyl-ACP methyl ester carboxylesterase